MICSLGKWEKSELKLRSIIYNRYIAYFNIFFSLSESVTITPQDSRWVGAWWLGYMVSGLLTLIAALPLWFLPRALPENPQTSKLDHPSNQHKHTVSITEIAKGMPTI